MTSPLQASVAGLAVLCGGVFAQTPQGYPPPGRYLIDSEATSTVNLGTSTIERTERVVGSSGDRTVTQKSSLDGVPPQSQTYKGTAPMLQDTAAGQVHVSIGFLAEVDKQYIAPGRVIALGVLGPRRLSARFPDLPTMAELGYPNFELLS